VDLIILDILENLPVPNLSSPATSVPQWNTLQVGFLDHVFDFASVHVQDRGAILLFFPNNLELKAMLRGYMTTYSFALFREWMGINRLRMTSVRDKTKTVSILRIFCFISNPSACPHFNNSHSRHLTCAQTLRFCIWLMVKTFPRASEPAFSFQPIEELEALGIDVSTNDILHNLVMKDSQLMKGSTPWRGTREKDPLLMQMLIESTTSLGDLVMDCTASTGKSP
jgi:hypothetical protein